MISCAEPYVFRLSGTICHRKQQAWLVDFMTEMKRNKSLALSSGLPRASNNDFNINILLIGAVKPSLLYQQKLVTRVEQAGLRNYIRFIPRTLTPEEYYLAADIHTSVSTHESFPLNTLELMCHGESYGVLKA
jgi:glycosyltransferase involved in cell wall biosynthesis